MTGWGSGCPLSSFVIPDLIRDPAAFSRPGSIPDEDGREEEAGSRIKSGMTAVVGTEKKKKTLTSEPVRTAPGSP
jgi:hypothetical protein